MGVLPHIKVVKRGFIVQLTLSKNDQIRSLAEAQFKDRVIHQYSRIEKFICNYMIHVPITKEASF